MLSLRTISIRRATTAALAGAMILSLLPAATLGASQPPRPARQAEWQILSLMNHYRAQHGLAPLRMARRVQNVARDRSTDMRDRNYFDHASPSGVGAADMLDRRGIQYFGGSENIGRMSFIGWDDSTRIMVDAWKGSSGHRANLLSKDVNYVGIGAARSNSVALYTMVFVSQRDHTAPASGMVASQTGISVASETGRKSVTIRWWGRDRALQQRTAGIRGFTVQKQTPSGWRTLRRNTLTRSLTIDLAQGTHKFRVRAVDKRGNAGSWRRPLTVTVH